MPVPIVKSVQHWHCPLCQLSDVTYEPEPHTRFHSCPALSGLSTPLASGVSGCRTQVLVREDYIGSEDVAMVDGKPIMGVSTEYRDGHNDVAVYAPTAHAGSEQ